MLVNADTWYFMYWARVVIHKLWITYPFRLHKTSYCEHTTRTHRYSFNLSYSCYRTNLFYTVPWWETREASRHWLRLRIEINKIAPTTPHCRHILSQATCKAVWRSFHWLYLIYTGRKGIDMCIILCLSIFITDSTLCVPLQYYWTKH